MQDEAWRGCCNTTTAMYHDAECLSEANQKWQRRRKLVIDLVLKAHEMGLTTARVDNWGNEDVVKVNVEDFQKLMWAYEE
jgi:hypothetical protein